MKFAFYQCLFCQAETFIKFLIMSPSKCPICNKGFLNHSPFIHCGGCSSYIHCNCTDLNREEFNYFRSQDGWLCKPCLSTALPFNHIEENSEFLNAVYSVALEHYCVPVNRFSNLVFNPFETNDDDCALPFGDIDPDIMYFNEISYKINMNSNYYLENSFNDYLKKNDINEESLSMLHLNIRSIPKNLSTFVSYISNINLHFTVLGFTETFLTDDNKSCYELQGFKHLAITKSQSMGHGVSIFIDERFDSELCLSLTLLKEHIECLFVKIEVDNISVIVGIVYRPPNSNLDDYLDDFINITESIKRMGKTCYILGDVNLDLMKYESHRKTSQYLDLLFSNSFIPLINRPTRITQHSATLIDHIYTNNYNINDKLHQAILVTDISDHLIILHILQKETKRNNDNDEDFIVIRQLNERNKENYKQNLTNWNWDEILRYDSAKVAFSKFHEVHSKIYDKSFPLKRVKKKYRNRIPWLSDDLKLRIKNKNQAYKTQLEHPTCYNREVYVKLRNSVTYAIRKEEKMYYQNILAENKNNLKKTWQIIKSVINKNKRSSISKTFKIDCETSDNEEVISNQFNDFFINIGPNLASKIPPSNKNFNEFLPTSNINSIYLEPMTTPELIKIMKSLNNGAPGYDEVNTECVKYSMESLAELLTHLINLSFRDGIFPDELKIAKVVPLYKANDPMMFSNYRPVSILPFFSKLFERAMYNRLITFFKRFDLLYKYQFGFRDKYSTYMAMMILLDNITMALDNGDYAIGVFLDFQKAFDTVNHDILLSKLYNYGIRGSAYNWISSYLDNRKQYVTYGTCSSEQKLIKCGVPQGSILGPLLFLVYINDLASVSDLFLSVLFADDSNLFCAGPNLNELILKINDEMVNICDWLNSNKLSLHVGKTNYMIFSPKGKPIIHDEDILINRTTIKRISHVKFLGIIIDDKLSWSDHTRYIRGKVAKGFGVLLKARKVFNKETLITLYYSMIFPYLSYCIHIWGSAYQCHLKDLTILQKRIVRVISGVPPMTHTDPLFKELKILSIRGIFVYAIGIFMFKFSSRMLPAKLFEHMFRYTSDHNPHFTRQRNSLYIDTCSTTRSQKNVKFIGARIWNVLIRQINVSCTIGTFKKYLRSLLQTIDLDIFLLW